MISATRILLPLLAVAAVAGMSPPDEAVTEPARGLLSSDPALVAQARNEILSARKAQVAGFVEIVEDKNDHGYELPTVRAAIRILGEWRAVEAVDPLVGIIGYPEVRALGRPPSRNYLSAANAWPSPFWEEPPQASPAEALLRIGQPCVPSVLRKISQTDNYTELVQCMKVLYFLRGRDGAESVLKAAGAGMDGAPAARLAKALDMLKEAPERANVPPGLRAYLPAVSPEAGGE